MKKRVMMRGLDLKILLLLAMLGLSNLANYDEVGGPTQECCELLNSLITFDPDPVKICAGREGSSIARFGELAQWEFLTIRDTKLFASRNIQRGPSTRSEIKHRTHAQLEFRNRQKPVTVKIKAIPEDKKKPFQTRWLSILVKEEKVLPSASAGSELGSTLLYMQNRNRIDFRFEVFCGKDLDSPEPGPWSFSITETSSWMSIRLASGFEKRITIPSPFQTALGSQTGDAVFQLVSPVQPRCNKRSCIARTFYKVTAQGGDPNRTVTNEIIVDVWVQPDVEALGDPQEDLPRVAAHGLPSIRGPKL